MFPGAGFKRKAKAWRKIARALNDVPLIEVKRQIVSCVHHTCTGRGYRPPFFHRGKLADSAKVPGRILPGGHGQGNSCLDQASMYAAGSDTTATVLATFSLAMLSNPEAQKKAQLEIDSVTGQARLPDQYLTSMTKFGRSAPQFQNSASWARRIGTESGSSSYYELLECLWRGKLANHCPLGPQCPLQCPLMSPIDVP
ncbi:hypothetical protein C8R47DRAFT_960977 [Mycena vitilis]|nr:hypothetical protein C8R47DRAFT_960977 [Mycena vitilis]